MKKEIDNTQDVLDSRDIIERIEELESEQEDFQSEHKLEDYPGFEKSDEESKWTEWDNSDEGQELKNLLALQEELKDYCPDWEYGVMLIRDDYFEDYTQELLEDIGDLPKDLPSYIAIDWAKTADNIQVDYTSGEFDGVTYWAR